LQNCNRRNAHRGYDCPVNQCYCRFEWVNYLNFRTASKLNQDTLVGLASGGIDVIHQRGFWACAEREYVVQRIEKLCEASRYALTRDFSSVGISVGDASESSDREELYLATALDVSIRLREAFGKNGFPGDKMRAVVDELWPAGALAGRIQGRLMLPMNVRKWGRGDSARPHIDQCGSALMGSFRLKMRIGVNIYVEVPPEGGGGELDFWGFPVDEGSYEAARKGSYGVERQELGEPYETLRPVAGDLILFNAARLHGVRKVEVGSRVTVAGFLGVRGDGEPLVIFC
jgi:hypothetical protein